MFNDKIENTKVPRGTFDLGHSVRTSYQMGRLIPIMAIDVLPGDRVTLGGEHLTRFAPLAAPVMHEVECDTHYFMVPTRLLNSVFTDWIANESNAAAPYINAYVRPTGSLADYFNIPLYGPQTGNQISAYPFAAYLKIYNDYYRDQNLIPEYQEADLTSGMNAALDIIAKEPPLRRAWRHDYFTAALPTAQQGTPVELPLLANNSAPVINDPTSTVPGRWVIGSNKGIFPSNYDTQVLGGTGFYTNDGVAASPLQYDPQGHLVVSLNGEATSIIDVRRAFALQEILEKNMRGGRRYNEVVKNHFNVNSEDARLQRPELIGGMTTKIAFSEVLSTAQTVDQNNNDIPIGGFGGHGYGMNGSQKFTYEVKEHGWIIGIQSVRPKTAYFQGIEKKFLRSSWLDYAWPGFQHIGEQEIELREVWAETTTALEGLETFGYVPRYSEYKFENDKVTGKMRTDLKFWHLATEFANKPVLNREFIECEPSTRIFSVTDDTEDHIYALIHNHFTVDRALSYYSNPKL